MPKVLVANSPRFKAKLDVSGLDGGWTVITANTFDQAMSLGPALEPDVIIAGPQPGAAITPVGFFQQARKERAMRHAHCIVIADENTSEREQRALTGHGIHVVPVTITPTQLREKLEELVTQGIGALPIPTPTTTPAFGMRIPSSVFAPPLPPAPPMIPPDVDTEPDDVALQVLASVEVAEREGRMLGNTLSISRTRLILETQHILTENQPVRAQFFLPGARERMKIDGVVKQPIDLAQMRYTIVFGELEPAMKRNLETFLASRKA